MGPIVQPFISVYGFYAPFVENNVYNTIDRFALEKPQWKAEMKTRRGNGDARSRNVESCPFFSAGFVQTGVARVLIGEARRTFGRRAPWQPEPTWHNP